MRAHKGWRILGLEPTNNKELMASPMAVTCFKYVGCFEFCERIQRVQHHPILSRLFISNLHENQVTLAGVTFTVSTTIIVASTRILNVGEKWYKEKDLENHYYEPYIKPRYKNEVNKVFHFSYLLDRYSPMMKIIMKYFSCEGRFFRLYTYLMQLLMHFTRVKILNIPYYIFKNIYKMAYIVQKRDCD